MASTASTPTKNNPDQAKDDTLKAICESLRGLQFGSITVTVQDGVVVQIDRTEKKRLART